MRLDSDDFELFDLPRRFELDPVALDARWRELQAEVHPDRFVSEGSASQRLAMQWAVRVNEAYRRLKDPLLRATTLCRLGGVEVNADSNVALPTSFLVEQMEWREALDEADSVDAVRALEATVADRRRADLDRLYDAIDVRNDLKDAARLVIGLMFVERFAGDIDRRLEALGQ